MERIPQMSPAYLDRGTARDRRKPRERAVRAPPNGEKTSSTSGGSRGFSAGIDMAGVVASHSVRRPAVAVRAPGGRRSHGSAVDRILARFCRTHPILYGVVRHSVAPASLGEEGCNLAPREGQCDNVHQFVMLILVDPPALEGCLHLARIRSQRR